MDQRSWGLKRASSHSFPFSLSDDSTPLFLFVFFSLFFSLFPSSLIAFPDPVLNPSLIPLFFLSSAIQLRERLRRVAEGLLHSRRITAAFSELARILPPYFYTPPPHFFLSFFFLFLLPFFSHLIGKEILGTRLPPRFLLNREPRQDRMKRSI